MSEREPDPAGLLAASAGGIAPIPNTPALVPRPGEESGDVEGAFPEDGAHDDEGVDDPEEHGAP